MGESVCDADQGRRLLSQTGLAQGFVQPTVHDQCDGLRGDIRRRARYGNSQALDDTREQTTYVLLSRQSGGALKHCALPTLSDCCVDTRSFAEVAEVTQRKFCQENRCRARQRPQEICIMRVRVAVR